MSALASLLVVTLAITAGGMRCTRLLACSPRDPRDDLLVGMAVGNGLLGLTAFGLAYVGWLNWLPITAVLALGAATGARPLWEAVRTGPWRPGAGGLALLAVMGLLLLAETAALLSPAITGDQTKYQLAYPKLYAAAGGLVSTPWTFWGQQQFLQNFVFAAGYALHGEALARLLNGLTAVMAAAAVGRLVDRHLLPGAGLVAAALMFTQPMTWSLTTRAGADLALVAYTALAVTAFVDWRRDGGGSQLRRVAVVAGLAGATKVMGLLTPGLLGLGMLVGGGRPLAQRLRAALVFGCLVGVLAAPPYLRNLVEVGNPLHPFAHSVFEGANWSSEAAGYLDEYYRQYRGLRAARRGAEAYTGFAWLRFPWDLTMYPESFERAARQSLDVGPFTLAFLPAALWVAIADPRRRVVLLLGTTYLAIIAGGAWAHPRYVLPALALLLAVAVPGARMLLGRRAFAALVAVTIAGQLVVSSRLLGPLWPDQVRVALGHMTPADYRERHSWRYRFWNEANRRIPEDGRVLVLAKIPHPYFIERPFVLGSYLEQVLLDYRRIETAADLAAAIDGLGVSHMAVHIDGLDAGADPYETRVVALWRELVRRQDEALLTRDGYALFALSGRVPRGVTP